MALALSTDELALLSNALNEMCNGIHIDDEELRLRTGFSREEGQALLDRLQTALSERTSAGVTPNGDKPER